MKKTITILTVLFLCLALLTSATDECLDCHSSIVGGISGDKYHTSVHYKHNISCADCHGGDKFNDDDEEAKLKSTGFIGVPKESEINKMCISCHGDSGKMGRFKSKIDTKQFLDFKKTSHAQKKVLNCVSCHGIHDIQPKGSRFSSVSPKKEVEMCSKCHSDANYMKLFNSKLPTDQHEKYLTSEHGKLFAKGDYNAATCSDCHSPHAIFKSDDIRSSTNVKKIAYTCGNCHSDKDYMKNYDIKTDQLDNYLKSVHGKTLYEKNDISSPSCDDCHGNHGATPDGYDEVSHVCASCHVMNADLFKESPHAEHFEEENIPQCIVCHDNHLIESPNHDLIIDKEHGCVSCHEDEDDKGYIAAMAMYEQFKSLRDKSVLANFLLDSAEVLGMDISDIRFDLLEIHENIIMASANTHKASLEEFLKLIAPGHETAEYAINAGNEAIYDFYMRRWGLGAASLLITLLIVTLHFKIRNIEKMDALKIDPKISSLESS